MESLTISVSPEMKTFIDERLKQANHATLAEYIESLLREDQVRAERDKLERMLRESRKGGTSIVINSDDELTAYIDKKKDALLAKYNTGASR